MRLIHCLPLVLLTVAAPVVLPAQEADAPSASRELAEAHPSAQVVIRYLRASVKRDYRAAARLVDPASLKQLQEDYVKKVRDPALPFDQVQALCRAVGVKDEDEIPKMSPEAFYAAYNDGMQRRYNVTDEANKRLADSLDLKLLSVAEEGPSLVHLVVRTQHQTPRHVVKSLEIVSLLRVKGQWLIALGEQKPKFIPLDEAKGQAKSPVIPTPAGETPPR